MAQLNVVIVCQARTGSSRLQRKVLLPLCSEPLILRFIERVRRSKFASKVVVASTIDTCDDALVDVCLGNGIDVMRGHPTDLLERHYQAGLMYNADVVVKIPSDCPLIDPAIIDTVIHRFIAQWPNIDFVSNLHPATWPDGNDVEVMSMEALTKAYMCAQKEYEREHTTPWLWDANPTIRTDNVVWSTGRDLSMSSRWTIDYPEDYMFVKAVYDALYPINPRFELHDILALLDARPEIAAVNAHLAGVNWYRNYVNELRTISCEQTKQYPSAIATA